MKVLEVALVPIVTALEIVLRHKNPTPPYGRSQYTDVRSLSDSRNAKAYKVRMYIIK